MDSGEEKYSNYETLFTVADMGVLGHWGAGEVIVCARDVHGMACMCGTYLLSKHRLPCL